MESLVCKFITAEDAKRVEELLQSGLDEARAGIHCDSATDIEAVRFTRALDSALAWDTVEERVRWSRDSQRCDGTSRVEANEKVALVLSVPEQKRLRWCQYACAVLANGETTTVSAKFADEMLLLEAMRFGS